MLDMYFDYSHSKEVKIIGMPKILCKIVFLCKYEPCGAGAESASGASTKCEQVGRCSAVCERYLHSYLK